MDIPPRAALEQLLISMLEEPDVRRIVHLLPLPARPRARTHTEAARAIVADTGYHRRDRELAALDAALAGKRFGTH